MIDVPTLTPLSDDDTMNGTYRGVITAGPASVVGRVRTRFAGPWQVVPLSSCTTAQDRVRCPVTFTGLPIGRPSRILIEACTPWSTCLQDSKEVVSYTRVKVGTLRVSADRPRPGAITMLKVTYGAADDGGYPDANATMTISGPNAGRGEPSPLTDFRTGGQFVTGVGTQAETDRYVVTYTVTGFGTNNVDSVSVTLVVPPPTT